MPRSELPGPGISVLLLADPGLPSRRAHAVRQVLERELDTAFAQPVSLNIRTEVLRIKPDDSLDLTAAASLRHDYDRVDVVLMLTEIPRHSDGRPMLAEVFPDQQIAVISCPTLGITRTRRRIVRVLLDATLAVYTSRADLPPRRYRSRWSSWDHVKPADSLILHGSPRVGGLRTVLGMVMANEPWRTAPLLSSAMSTAFATGAFGIFYNSIWQMSDRMSVLRLTAVGLTAILSMVAWLILSNRLWDQPRHRSLAAVILLYNLSTVVALTCCVLALYALLVLVILLAAAIVIDPSFMASVIDGPVTFRNYLEIAWFSASMGVVAGGLGSSFDARADLRRLTHGLRERQRQYTDQETQ